jgi:hypothetical protein
MTPSQAIRALQHTPSPSTHQSSLVEALLVLPPVLHAVLLGAAITSLCCTAGLALQLSPERRRHGSVGNHPGQLSSYSRCVATSEQCNMQHMLPSFLCTVNLG